MHCELPKKNIPLYFPGTISARLMRQNINPRTIAYSPELIWKILQETLNELARNGFEKIILVNGHGGNNAFLNFFGMAQLSERRSYSLYLFQPTNDPGNNKKSRRIDPV